MKINANDLLGSYDINIDTKKSEPACMECLPPKPLKDHKSLSGMLIHERIDCPHALNHVMTSSSMIRSVLQSDYTSRKQGKVKQATGVSANLCPSHTVSLKHGGI